MKLKDTLQEVRIKVGTKFNYNGLTWEVVKSGITQSRARAITKAAKGQEEIIDNDVISQMTEAVNVDTYKYQGSHGKLPKGSGGWMFSLESYGKQPEEIRVNGNYGTAKKEAMKTAKSKGYDTVVVLP